VNRELPPGDRANRSSDSGWQSRPPGSVPGTRGLVCRAKDPPKGATPPGTSPAAREGQNKRDSGFERVGSFFVLAFCGRERQTHFLANRSGQEPTAALGLPGGCFHQFGERGAVRPLQKFEDLLGPAPLPRVRFLLGGFGGLRALGGLLGRGGHPLPDLPLPGATRVFRGAVLGVLVGSGSRVVAAWRACSSAFGIVIVNSPYAVITAVRTSIAHVGKTSKRILRPMAME
jgi:hypothetical protein